MTRKDYEAIANIICGDIRCSSYESEGFYALRNLSLSLSDLFKHDDPRFDRRKFLIACGLTAGDAPMTLTTNDDSV